MNRDRLRAASFLALLIGAYFILLPAHLHGEEHGHGGHHHSHESKDDSHGDHDTTRNHAWFAIPIKISHTFSSQFDFMSAIAPDDLSVALIADQTVCLDSNNFNLPRRAPPNIYRRRGPPRV